MSRFRCHARPKLRGAGALEGEGARVREAERVALRAWQARSHRWVGTGCRRRARKHFSGLPALRIRGAGWGGEAKRRRRVAGPASGVRRDALLRRAPRRVTSPTRLCTRVGLTGTPHRAVHGALTARGRARGRWRAKSPRSHGHGRLCWTHWLTAVCARACCIAVCAGSRASPSSRQRTGCVRERVRGRRSAPPIRWARRGRRRDGQRAMDDTRRAPRRAGR